MGPHHVDADDLAELREGRVFVHRSRDPWTDGAVYARIVSWNLDRVQFEEVRHHPGKPDDLVGWDVGLEQFFAGVFDRWHEGDEVPPAPPPTGGHRLHLRRRGAA